MDEDHVPAWLRDAVIYHVFIDRFATSGGVVFATPPTPSGFFGGTLRGVIARLDYIAALGADCIWLSPLFPSPTHHGYDATDYRGVEPRLELSHRLLGRDVGGLGLAEGRLVQVAQGLVEQRRELHERRPARVEGVRGAAVERGRMVMEGRRAARLDGGVDGASRLVVPVHLEVRRGAKLARPGLVRGASGEERAQIVQVGGDDGR